MRQTRFILHLGGLFKHVFSDHIFVFAYNAFKLLHFGICIYCWVKTTKHTSVVTISTLWEKQSEDSFNYSILQQLHMKND